MSDIISRQAAINSLTEIIMNLKNVYGDMGSAVNGARECIKSLPSAEPEERTANVIKHKYWLGVSLNVAGEQTIGYEWLCENCKKKVIDGDDYCSHCGSKLIWGDENDF